MSPLKVVSYADAVELIEECEIIEMIHAGLLTTYHLQKPDGSEIFLVCEMGSGSRNVVISPASH